MTVLDFDLLRRVRCTTKGAVFMGEGRSAENCKRVRRCWAVIVDRIPSDYLDTMSALWRLINTIDDMIEPVLLMASDNQSGFLEIFGNYAEDWHCRLIGRDSKKERAMLNMKLPSNSSVIFRELPKGSPFCFQGRQVPERRPENRHALIFRPDCRYFCSCSHFMPITLKRYFTWQR